MKQPTFVISEFTNPSGEIVFRVAGRLDGKRIRKNFPTRAEAKAELQALEIEATHGDTGLRRTVTRLPEEQMHEAEAVFLRLQGQSHSLTFCVDYTLAKFSRRLTLWRRPSADLVRPRRSSSLANSWRDWGAHLTPVRRAARGWTGRGKAPQGTARGDSGDSHRAKPPHPRTRRGRFMVTSYTLDKNRD